MYGIIFPIIFYFLSAILVAILPRYIKRPASVWFIGATGAIVSWLITLGLGIHQSANWIISFGNVSQFLGKEFAFIFLVDNISWGYLVSITTLILAVLLTESSYHGTIVSNGWAYTLGLGGVGVFAVTSGNLLTFSYTWTLLSVIILVILITTAGSQRIRKTAIINFVIQMLGISLLILGMMSLGDRVSLDAFMEVPQNIAILFILAAGALLGVILPDDQLFIERNMKRGFGTVLRLIPVTSSLVFISRLQFSPSNDMKVMLLILVIFIIAIYGSFHWILERNLFDGRLAWIMVGASLTLITKLFGLNNLTILLGQAIIFSSALIFLTKITSPLIYKITRMGLVVILGFPLVIGNGFVLTVLNQPEFPLFYKILLITLFNLLFSLQIFGYFMHSYHINKNYGEIKPYGNLLSVIGLILILLVQLLTIILGFVNGQFVFLRWWVGMVPLAISIGFYYFYLHNVEKKPSGRYLGYVDKVFSLDWIYQIILRTYKFLGGIIHQATMVIEGDAGFLWAVLIAALLIAIFSKG
ncbi:MAG TPA: hypothetical protein G4N95_02190 [Anaerolineae bacterium]|nr:hypothetical protein [Anaerolineae bacterium]